MWELFDGQATGGILTCKDFGLNRHSLNKVVGGRKCGNGQKYILFERQKISLRCWSLYPVVAGLAKDYKERTKLARESILSALWRSLKTFKDEGPRFTNKVIPFRI